MQHLDEEVGVLLQHGELEFDVAKPTVHLELLSKTYYVRARTYKRGKETHHMRGKEEEEQ